MRGSGTNTRAGAVAGSVEDLVVDAAAAGLPWDGGAAAGVPVAPSGW